MRSKSISITMLCSSMLMGAGVLALPASALAAPAAAVAPAHQITGVVTDADGPLIGASVRIKGNNKGVVTDIDGKFVIDAKPGTILEISSVGCKPVEVKATEAPMLINLESDTQVLSEVVVTALGIKRDRKALGYGLDEVKGEAFAKAKETNVINSMAGRVAGLVVSGTASGPSGSSRVILRGATEMTGNNQPLYVVDGVPLDNTNFGSAGTNGGYDLGDGISSINPDDIESMSVLKGPAASALYGSRASHGVILITTKKAQGETKYSVEYNGTMTVERQLSKWNNVQQTYGMGSNGRYSIDAVSNTNKSWGPKADGGNMLTYFDGVARPYLIVPDNTANFFRTGLTANNTVTVNSNTGNTGMRFTVTDMRNRDIIPNTNMSRDIFNLRSTTALGKVDLDFSVNYTHEHVKNRPALGDSKSNIGKNLMTLATTYDQRWLRQYENAAGEYSNWNGMDPYNVNPYWDIYKNLNVSDKDLFRLHGTAIYNVTSHLKVKATVGAELNWFKFTDFKAASTPGYEAGYMQMSNFHNQMYNMELLGTYNNRWGQFDVTATAGGNIYKVDNLTNIVSAQDMQIRDVIALMSFNETSNQQNTYRKQINSLFATANIGWRNLVYLDATVRGDRSSTLPTGNNTYVYPSFSGSLVFSELIRRGDILPYGKIRASCAQVGSDTDPYQLGLVYTKSKYTYPGFTIGYIDNATIPNKNLKPTRTNSFEMGLETKFLNSRIGLDVTYYNQVSRDQIMGMASSWSTGYPYRLINAGEIQNKGVEIALNTRPVAAGDFTWDVNFNFSRNQNKVRKLVDDVDMFELEKATWLDVQIAAKVGENFGSIVGPDFARNDKGEILIDPATGMPKYDKTNHVLGNASWDWTGGLNTTLRWRNLGLTSVFDVKWGGDLYSMSARASYESGKALGTLEGRDAWYASEEQRMALGYAKGSADWQPTGGFIAPGVIENEDGTYRPNDIIVNPEDYWMSVCRNAPSMFIYDNSYVKCREISLSYQLPQSWLNGGKVVKDVTLSLVARNPFIVWKNIPDIDPDSNYNNTTGMGMEYGSMPSRKSYGLNVYVRF